MRYACKVDRGRISEFTRVSVRLETKTTSLEKVVRCLCENQTRISWQARLQSSSFPSDTDCIKKGGLCFEVALARGA